MRPFPVHPRGPRKRRPPHETLLLACPKFSPQWELSALRALMKPQTRGAIEHTSPEQKWPFGLERDLREVCGLLGERLGFPIEPIFPDGNEFHMVITLPGTAWLESLAAARAISGVVPACWFTLGRVFIRDGKFFNRERGYKLNLRPSKHHRVPRAIAAKVRNLFSVNPLPVRRERAG